MTEALVEQINPDVVVVATGAKPRWPELEGVDEAHVVHAWQVLKGEANVGSSVVVADWRADWTGIGVAEKLARDGCHVRLYVNANMAVRPSTVTCVMKSSVSCRRSTWR